MKISDLQVLISSSRSFIAAEFKAVKHPKFITLEVNLRGVFFDDQWEKVCTARGEEKKYYSFNAIFQDIERIQPEFSGDIIFRIMQQTPVFVV